MFNRLVLELHVLQGEGRIHKTLTTRLWVLFGIASVFGLITLVNLFLRPASYAIAFLVFLAGFILGYHIFFRMSAIEWSEAEEVVKVSRTDTVGYASLALYALYELMLHTLLQNLFPTSSAIYVLTGIFGALLGRAIGTIFEIHSVYRVTRTAHADVEAHIEQVAKEEAHAERVAEHMSALDG